MSKCDKCGLEVAMKDDAVALSSVRDGTPWQAAAFMCGSRHIRCSPSRAQYITEPEFGEPVIDERPAFDKRLREERGNAAHTYRMNAAWRKLQRLAKRQEEIHAE